ncbi:MAG: phage virion morphogenesis protein [Burkholderiaceae bacterium]|nr:phage virion morphogenesis protein [Burkholderiaceae bacterium]
MIRIDLDDTQVQRLLADLQQRLGNLTPAMAQIGEALAEGSKQRIEAGRDWRGKSFAPNKPSTLARKKGARPLIDTGTLLHNRIHYSANAHSATVAAGGVQAAVMQFGQKKGASGAGKRGKPIPWGDIPPRPFLPISPGGDLEPKARDLVLDILRAWVADAGG